MSNVPQVATMPADACTRIVEKVAATCQPAAQALPPSPNYDALAASIASQANAISSQSSFMSMLSVLIAIVALVGVAGWTWYVKTRAETVAKDEARAAVAHWMNTTGVGLISDLVAELTPPMVDGGNGAAHMVTQAQQERDLGGEDPKAD